MSKGRRYNTEGQLNYTKVFAVIIAIVVLIMCILIIRNSLANARNTQDEVATQYFALYANNKWGIIDSKGEIEIEPMYQEMLIVLNSKRDVFLCTYDVNEKTGEYKTKVINRKNEEIYKGYDKIEVLDNYNSSGNAWYEEDTFKVQKNGKYGLMNIDGKQILKPEYDSIETLKGLENSILVTKDGKVGLVNKSGATVIDPEFSKIEKISEDYKEGYITIDSNKKYGLVSYTGNKILENKYEKITAAEEDDYFVIEEKGTQKVIEQSGKVVLEKGYDKISELNQDGLVFIKDNKYGFMDYTGKVLIKEEYDKLEEINTGILKAIKDKKCGLIDLKNKTKIKFEYENIYYEESAGFYVAEDEKYTATIIDKDFRAQLMGILSELNKEKGYMRLQIKDKYKYYNFKFEEKDITEVLSSNNLFVSRKNNKYGFVDKEGNVVVDYIYDEAEEQNAFGFAAVKKNKVWGAINSEGKEVVTPKYKLDNYLIIDFIGKWHVGQDLNMHYYCEK